MKRITLTALLAVLLMGCGTTFQERKEVYKAIYAKAKGIVIKAGPVVADQMLKKEIEKGSITEEEAEMIKALVEDLGK